MFEIDTLDHVALSVRDLERSARWYADVLGFKRLHEGKWNGIPIFVGNDAAVVAARGQNESDDTAGVIRTVQRERDLTNTNGSHDLMSLLNFHRRDPSLALRMTERRWRAGSKSCGECRTLRLAELAAQLVSRLNVGFGQSGLR